MKLRLLTQLCLVSYKTLIPTFFPKRSLNSVSRMSFQLGMDLQMVVSNLEKLAPLSLAESWDNVGLLIEPSPPHIVKTMMLTNDLTEQVMDEALEKKVDFILSYHPPIFRPLKRLRSGTVRGAWKERLVVTALEGRVAVYSPHTACDCVCGGVNDWLGQALGLGSVVPISHSIASSTPSGASHRVELSIGRDVDAEEILSRLKSVEGAGVQVCTVRSDSEDLLRVMVNCTGPALACALGLLSPYTSIYQTVEVLALSKPPVPNAGPGRLCTLDEPVTIATALQRIKAHLRLQHVRLALGAQCTLESLVRTMAVCAGSGSSVLNGVKADLYLTGEMSHHDVLDAVATGTSVVLCDHSNTERGYLSQLGDQLKTQLEGKVDVLISESDRDPLQVM
ncbi:NIF3-like protein 1 [Erpetoichthys calabaricus]|uniref:NIF3-like protein 1 n=1 Tax=Erpetoichthys calabaricus TaxID=27687 RepID=UPI0022347481|nr:NIF3-like protein 1 [Erpetoichthys calabaricus]